MDTDKHPSNYDDLISDLYYLRKSEGFSAKRLRNASSLLYILGGRSQSFDTLRSRFISAMETLPDGQSKESLLAAYALTPDFAGLPLLRDRRAKLGLITKRKYDTLADRENAAISELAIRLLTAAYAESPLPPNISLPHGNYLLESLAVDTYMDNRVFVKHSQLRKVVSLTAGVRTFAYHVNEHTKLTPITGCEVETVYSDAGSIHTLVFPRPLKRGEAHLFGFVEESARNAVLKDVVETIDLAGQVFQTPTLSYVQKVEFSGERPKDIWTYKNMTNIERPGRPNPSNHLVLTTDGVAESEFKHLYGGLYSGVAWKW